MEEHEELLKITDEMRFITIAKLLSYLPVGPDAPRDAMVLERRIIHKALDCVDYELMSKQMINYAMQKSHRSSKLEIAKIPNRLILPAVLGIKKLGVGFAKKRMNKYEVDQHIRSMKHFLLMHGIYPHFEACFHTEPMSTYTRFSYPYVHDAPLVFDYFYRDYDNEIGVPKKIDKNTSSAYNLHRQFSNPSQIPQPREDADIPNYTILNNPNKRDTVYMILSSESDMEEDEIDLEVEEPIDNDDDVIML